MPPSPNLEMIAPRVNDAVESEAGTQEDQIFEKWMNKLTKAENESFNLEVLLGFLDFYIDELPIKVCMRV